jgi:glycogen debranching enzyme
VWGWLIGPYVDAYLRVHPGDVRGAGRALEGIASHSREGCVGTIAEIFDGDAPFHPRGCIAQAWSVAEAIRALVRIRAR